MFTHDCTACNRTQLISLTMATSVEKVEEGGLHIAFTCWCGATQEHHLAPLARQDLTSAV